MNTQNANRHLVPAILGVVTLFVALLGSVAPASAGVSIGAGPDFPSSVTVGSNGAATFTIVNSSNGLENTAPLTLTDMQMVPACGSTFGGPPDNDCPLAFADPGVFTLSATATGRAGTACAQMTFDVILNNPVTGQVTFAPVGAPVTLAPAGTPNGADRCIIDFTYSVARMPSLDSQPAAPGLQTNALGFATGQNTIGGVTNTGTGTGADTVTVTAPALTLTTVAARNANGTIFDTATLAGAPAGGPAPTGTVTFTISPPNDPTCAGAPVFTSTNAVTGGTTSTSTPLLPGPGTGGAGTYRFVAVYSGDANYAPVTSPCNAPNEQVVVPAPVIQVVKTADPLTRVEPGGNFTFTVVVSNPSAIDPVTITSLTDNVYGNLLSANPNIANNTCTALLNATLAPGATAPSCSFRGTFTGPAGASQTDIVTVSGVDANGFTASDSDDAVVTITSRLIVPLSTVAVRNANGTISDTATIGPPPAGAPAPTGTVTFQVYGPNDPTCAGTPVFTSTNTVTGGGTAVSTAFLPGPSTGGAGTYRYVATYSGDATYQPVMSPCGAPNEQVVIPSPVIQVVKTADPLTRVAPGGNFTFTVVASNPSAIDPILITSLTDNVYGNLFGANPSITNNTCAGLQGTTLAPGASAPACSFTGSFTGSAGASQTDVVTISGVDQNGFSATDNDDATVTLTAPPPPAVTTGSASAVSGSGASLAGTVNPNGVATAYIFEYGTSLSFGAITPPTSAGSGSSPVAVSESLAGLSAATTYYYRLVATNSNGQTTFGVVRSFRTTGTGQAPVAVTGAASAITISGATLNGQVNPRGSQTSFTFEYGTSLTFGNITPVVALDDADAFEPVSATLSGLASNTTYYYRTVATNATGTSIGVVGSFATGPGGAPVVATGAATNVTATSAMLNGSVNPNGWPTAYTFEYGPTLTFGSISAVESAGSGQRRQRVRAADHRLVSRTRPITTGSSRRTTTARPPAWPGASRPGLGSEAAAGPNENTEGLISATRGPSG